jgi:HK97 family phage portal protein
VSLFSRQQRVSVVDGPVIPDRPRLTGTGSAVARVNTDSAMRHSAVWAALRLRADLISSMPVDVYRKINGIQVEMQKPPVLVTPGGSKVKIKEWMYSSQIDLDRAGNVCGLITARDGMGYPAVIELQELAATRIKVKDGKINKFVFRGVEYEPEDVWHEKQYTIAGCPVGLSPVSYAAWSISQYLTAQQFSVEWFGSGGLPAAELKNTAKTVTPKESEDIKLRFKATVGPGDVFVHGNDWEYSPLQAVESDQQWINTQQYGVPEIARFFSVPADMIDGAVSGSSVTYASISQRNLQLMIVNIGAPVGRREDALSDLLPKPRFVKLNSDAILRMDPETRARVLGQQVRDRLRAPSEQREVDDLPPFTDEQLAEFDRIFGPPKSSAPTNTPVPTTGGTP